MGLNGISYVCSLKDVKAVQHNFIGSNDTLEDHKLPSALNPQKFKEYAFLGLQSTPMEQSDVILENSINSAIENKRNIYDWTTELGDATSSLNQSDEIEMSAWRSMPSELSDFILEISANDTNQQNDLFCLPSSWTFGSKTSKTNQPFNAAEENNSSTQLRMYKKSHKLLHPKRDESDVTCLETIRSELSDVSFEASPDSEAQENVTVLKSFQSCTDALMDTDSYPGGMELFNTDSKVVLLDTPDNSMFTNDVDSTISEDTESLLEALAALDNSIKSSLHQGMTTSREQDEIGNLSSFTRDSSAHYTTNVHQMSFNKFPVNEIMIANGQEKSGERSVPIYYRLNSKDSEQSNDILRSQRGVTVEDSLPMDSNERNQQRTNSYRRTHREHVNYLQRKRVEKLNHGYKCLHASLPPHLSGQKLSKLEILVEAIRYIRLLDNILISCENTDRLDSLVD